MYSLTCNFCGSNSGVGLKLKKSPYEIEGHVELGMLIFDILGI
jgi:hypothetical protein